MTVHLPPAAIAVAAKIDVSSAAHVHRAAGGHIFARVGDAPGLALAAADDVAEMTLYDEIGFFGVTAAAFREQLGKITARKIVLSINSPGGDVFDGVAMHNDLVAHGAEVEVRVTGIAASAASIVAMAGDRVLMASNAFLMIHNAWALAVGDKSAMRAMGDVLEKIDAALAETYAERTGATVADMAALMQAETWLTADEAIAQHFADAKIDAEADGAQALFDLSLFAKVPAPLKRRIESGLRDAGYTRSQASAASVDGFGLLPPRDAANVEANRVARDERRLLAEITHAAQANARAASNL